MVINIVYTICYIIIKIYIVLWYNIQVIPNIGREIIINLISRESKMIEGYWYVYNRGGQTASHILS